jgi:hypothetical protein
LIERYGLDPHPEGGYYREMWRSQRELPASALPDHPGPRRAGTSIIYLLEAGTESAPHTVRSEELWLYQAGDPMELTVRPTPDDEAETTVIGPGEEATLQRVVPAGWWQSATPADGECGWSLVGCVVVPGFEFEDFSLF